MSNNVRKTFGERLKELRIEKGLSVKELSTAIGVSDVAIVYWENDKRTANIVALNTLADFFGVSADYLIGRED